MGNIIDVVKGGYCVGCGACSVATNGNITMQRNKYGFMQANLDAASATEIRIGSTVCPFSDDAKDEDALSSIAFSGELKHDKHAGHYKSIYAGRISDDQSITKSSSGGLTTWILSELIRNQLIDGVIHIGPGKETGDSLFEFSTSHSIEELESKRKSQYYSADFSKAMLSIRGNGKRYAFVGVPCYIKSARLLASEDKVLHEQLRFFVALICGHMKSAGFAELLSWQVGVAPKTIKIVDFRVKDPTQAASGYKFRSESKDGTISNEKSTRDLFGGNWGHAMFQLKACDFCDDVFGECADVALGDAWLEKYVSDWRGTNVLITRNDVIDEIISSGKSTAAITLDSISLNELIESQEGNFRHRWDGLSIRLAEAQKEGQWAPKKRIKPNSRDVTFLRKKIVILRQKMGIRSHDAFLKAKSENSLDSFFNEMIPMTIQMDKIYKLMKISTPEKFINTLKKKINKKLGLSR